MANTSAIVVNAFPAEKRGVGLGVNSMAYSEGAVMGPIVGGALLQISWHWIFWFNVPLGIFLLFWAWKSLPVDHSKSGTKRSSRPNLEMCSSWKLPVITKQATGATS